MNIEEAIDILQGIKDGTACLMKDMPRRGEKAIDIAIAVLSQADEDAVSRKAVIEITAETGALETQYRVKRLPPVTPKQRKGKWIEIHRKRDGKVIALRCDKCQKSPRFAIRSDYCPNCGAKMDKENE